MKHTADKQFEHFASGDVFDFAARTHTLDLLKHTSATQPPAKLDVIHESLDNHTFAALTMTCLINSLDESKEYWSEEGCFILELANTAADESCSIARARVPPGGDTRPHSLLNTVERYVILEGSGLVEINGSSPESVSRYDVVQIPADVSQKITNTGDTDLVFLCICTPRFQQASYVELD